MTSFAAVRRPSVLLFRRICTAAAATTPPPLSASHAFPPTLRRLVRLKDFAAIESLLEPLKSPPHALTEPHLSSIAASYAAAGMLSQSLDTLSSIPSPSSLSFNSLLSSLNHHPTLFTHVPSLFHDLPIKHPTISPDHVSYAILIKSHCKSRKAASKCFGILEEMKKKGFEINVVTYTTVLDSLYKEKKLKEAERVWKEMKEKRLDLDVAAYNVRVMHRAMSGKPEGVLKVVEEMEAAGLKPDVITKNYLIGCYCRNGKMKESKEVYEGMEKRNYRTYRDYLAALCKKGDLNEGLEVFNDAVKEGQVPDLGVVKVLVEGLVKAKRMRMAKRVVTGLRKKFVEDFIGGWLELEKLVGLNEGGDEDEKDVGVVDA